MNVLMINCSPVRDGATAKIVSLIDQFIVEKNDVRSVCIDDYQIQYCKGCRQCHTTARCYIEDDMNQLISEMDWADKIICVSPSYWADVPGQFKVFIDRCTPFSNTHQPHASLKEGKKGFAIALRTGPNMPECEKIISTINHFYGHMNIEYCGGIGLCSIEYKEDVDSRIDEIEKFCQVIMDR